MTFQMLGRATRFFASRKPCGNSGLTVPTLATYANQGRAYALTVPGANRPDANVKHLCECPFTKEIALEAGFGERD